jgi:hypothetical protein
MPKTVRLAANPSSTELSAKPTSVSDISDLTTSFRCVSPSPAHAILKRHTPRSKASTVRRAVRDSSRLAQRLERGASSALRRPMSCKHGKQSLSLPTPRKITGDRPPENSTSKAGPPARICGRASKRNSTNWWMCWQWRLSAELAYDAFY